MPERYTGNFSHFIYNGNTRFSISKKYNLPLDKLIANSIKDIPSEEIILGGSCLEIVLSYILCKKLESHSRIKAKYYCEYNLGYLLEEFNKLEKSRNKNGK